MTTRNFRKWTRNYRDMMRFFFSCCKKCDIIANKRETINKKQNNIMNIVNLNFNLNLNRNHCREHWMKKNTINNIKVIISVFRYIYWVFGFVNSIKTIEFSVFLNWYNSNLIKLLIDNYMECMGFPIGDWLQRIPSPVYVKSNDNPGN